MQIFVYYAGDGPRIFISIFKKGTQTIDFSSEFTS